MNTKELKNPPPTEEEDTEKIPSPEYTPSEIAVKVALITSMALSVFALGLYIANPTQVTAGTLKLFGYYGVGGGIYPIPGSDVGTIKKMSFNGQVSATLECRTSKSPREVLEYYSPRYKSKAYLNSDRVQHQPQRAPDGHWEFRDGLLQVKTPHYCMLGTINTDGERMGMVAYELGSQTRYFLYRSLQDGNRKRVEPKLIPSPNNSKTVFIQKTLGQKSGLYLFETSFSLETAYRSYRQILENNGWKESGDMSFAFSRASSSATLFAYKDGLQALVFFQPGRQRGKIQITVLLKPVIAQKIKSSNT